MKLGVLRGVEEEGVVGEGGGADIVQHVARARVDSELKRTNGYDRGITQDNHRTLNTPCSSLHSAPSRQS